MSFSGRSRKRRLSSTTSKPGTTSERECKTPSMPSTPSCSDTPESTRSIQTLQSHSDQHSLNSDCPRCPFVDSTVNPHVLLALLMHGCTVPCDHHGAHWLNGGELQTW